MSKSYPPAFKQLRMLTRDELAEVGSYLIKSDMDGLRDFAHDGKAPALLATFAKCLLRVWAEGDVHALDKLLDRIVGKVTERVEHTRAADGAARVVITIPSNGREVLPPMKKVN